MAREHGVFRTAKILRMEHIRLKGTVKPATPAVRRAAAAAPLNFLELGTPGSQWYRVRHRGGREKLNVDPFSGYLFIFRSRSGTAIRILQYGRTTTHTTRPVVQGTAPSRVRLGYSSPLDQFDATILRAAVLIGIRCHRRVRAAAEGIQTSRGNVVMRGQCVHNGGCAAPAQIQVAVWSTLTVGVPNDVKADLRIRGKQMADFVEHGVRISP